MTKILVYRCDQCDKIVELDDTRGIAGLRDHPDEPRWELAEERECEEHLCTTCIVKWVAWARYREGLNTIRACVDRMAELKEEGITE